jgi:hypothetical protein
LVDSANGLAPASHGIFDPACTILSQLHSDAVDFQKACYSES